MALPRFTFTDRARPFLELGVGDTRVPTGQARWDVQRWDATDAKWAGTEPTWLDYTCEGYSFEYEYGRQHTTDRFVAGTLNVDVDNASGWADPLATSDPASLAMRPGRAIRIGVDHVVYGRVVLFRGIIDALRPVYDATETADRVTLTCVDVLGEVNRAKFAGADAPVGADETPDARIGRLLTMATWPPSKRLLEPSAVALVADPLNGQAADLMGRAADSGGGVVFGDRDGNVVFRPRDWQTYGPDLPPDGSIGNVDDTPGHWTPAVPAQLDFAKGTVSTVAPIVPASQAQLTSDPSGVTVTQTGTTTLTGVPGGLLRSAQMMQANRRQLVFPGAAGNDLSVPNAANLSPTTDIDIVARVAPTSWRPAVQGTILAKYATAANQRSYSFALSTTGQLVFVMSTTGGDTVQGVSSVAVPNDGAARWVRATRVRSSGVVTFYTAPDADAIPTAWTALGTTVVVSAGTAIFASTAPVEVGGLAAATSNPFAGRIRRAILRTTIGGAAVLDVDELNASTVAPGASSFVATTGQTVTVWQTGPTATLVGSAGNVSTPDPGVLPNAFVIVWRARYATTAGFPVHAAQNTGADPRSWQSYPTLVNTRVNFEATPDGLWANRQLRYADRPVPPLNVDRTHALAVTQNSAGRHVMTAWTRDESTGAWTAGTTRDTGAALTAFDVTTVLTMGGGFVAGERLYWSEMRTGTDPRAGTLLYRFDASERTGTGLTYTDPRGRVWTLTAALAIAPGVQPIVQALPDLLVWRFDASEYPGTGTYFVDPRGQPWTLPAGAVTPAVPAGWVPGEACPISWVRPFDRADIATRAIFGRDLPTAVVVDDVEGQSVYGVEPFERTDLWTRDESDLTTLATRALRVRSWERAPVVRGVTLDARTSDAALDVMTVADPYRPTRYRCRLLLERGLVFDDQFLTTGVVVRMEPGLWAMSMQLDAASPYAAQGGRWDAAGWDRAVWTVAV